MNGKMSISDLSDQLSGLTPGGMTFIQAVSQVMARYYDAGIFKDLVARVVVSAGTSTGFITLPPQYECVLGIQCQNGQPLPVYGQFHEWQELGIGFIQPDEMTMAGVLDMGDGFITNTDIATEGTLRFKIYNAGDAAKTVRLFGVGTVNGLTNQVIYDSSGVLGLSLTTANPTADTTQTFSSLSPPFGGIQLPSNMVGMSELYVVNGATATLLARYEPGETRPARRRYKLGVVETDNILALCKLRFRPYRNNTDFVVPANVGALMAGLQALTKERALQYEEAYKIWPVGIDLLQTQLKSFRGSNKPRLPFLGKELMTGPTTVY
jgi:hypothetical protein